MSRAVRIEFDGDFYHVMSRGVARCSTFLDDEDRGRFLGIVGDLVDEGVLRLFAFCLMPNHYHLLLSTPEGDLSRWMRHVNGDYVRVFNHRHRRVGVLWQGRYKAILVEDASYLKECSRYIHLNPNRAKLTRPAERYRWSSYRNYVGGPSVAPFVEIGVVLGEFGGDRARYRRYVEAGKGEKLVSPFDRAVAGLVLGGEDFVARIRKRVGRLADKGDQPTLRRMKRLGKSEPERVEAAVQRIFADVGRARRGRLLLWAQREHSRLRPSEIARRYRRRHTAVAMAWKAVNIQREKDEELEKRLTALRRVLDRKSDV
jgi:putative transposase